MAAMSMEEGGASSRAGFYHWEPSFQPTNDTYHYVMPKMAIDSMDNIHLVFLNETYNITYLKMDKDQNILEGPTNIATSNMSWLTPPAIAVDGNDDVHISAIDKWTGGMMGETTFYFRYFIIDSGTGVVSEYNNTCGDQILVDDNDDVFCLQFYRYGGTNPPVTGPLWLRKLDGAGGEDWAKNLGQHKMGFYIADMTVTSSGDMIVVWSFGDHTLRLSRISAAGVTEVDGVLLDTGLSMGNDELEDVAITIDGNDDVQIFFAYGNPFDTERYVNHMISDVDGSVDHNEQVVDYGETRRKDIDVAGPDDAGVMAILYGSGADGSPFELSKSYRTKFVNIAGVIIRPQQEIIDTCPDNEGDLAINSTNAFFMVTDNRACFQGQPLTDKSDPIIFYTEPGPVPMFDLSVVEDDVVIPNGILQMEAFDLNVTIRNLETNASSDFNVTVSYKANSTEIGRVHMGPIGPEGLISLEFDLSFNGSTDLTIEVVPDIDQDKNMSNNILDITVSITERPNVLIVEDEVVIDPPSVRIGGDVSISIPVENTGGIDALMVMRIDPLITGDIIVYVTMGSKVWVNRTWSTDLPGDHDFTVSLHNITPAELPGMDGDNSVDLTVTYIDKSPPVVDIEVPTNGSVVPNKFFVNGTVVDPEGDPVTLKIFSDGFQITRDPVFDGLNFSFDLDLWEHPYGAHKITVQACDIYNCSSDSVDIILRYTEILARIIDWTPEEHNVTMLENGTIDFGITTWTNSELEFEYNWYFDSGWWSWASPNWTYNNSSFQKGVEVGNHTVKVTARIANIVLDMTWNVTVEEIVPPNAPPVITSNTPTVLVHDFGCDDTQLTIELTVDDPDGDLLVVEMYIDGKLKNTSAVVTPGSKVSFIVMKRDARDGSPVVFVVSDGKDNDTIEYTVSAPPPGACGGTPPPKPNVETTILDNIFWLILIVVIIVVATVLTLWFYNRRKALPTEAPQVQPEQQDPVQEDWQQPEPPVDQQEWDQPEPMEGHEGQDPYDPNEPV